MSLDDFPPNEENISRADIERFLKNGGYQKLISFTENIGYDPADAEDIVHNAIEKALENVPIFFAKKPKSTYEWFKMFINFLSLNAPLKEQNRNEPAPFNNNPVDPFFSFQKEKVFRAIEAMPEAKRKAMVDAMQGVNNLAVAELLTEAREELRKVLDEAGFEGLPRSLKKTKVMGMDLKPSLSHSFHVPHAA